MRLGQLARKLGITQSEITNFLESNGFEKIEGSNAKVPDDQEKLTIEHFAPEIDIAESESNVENINVDISDLISEETSEEEFEEDDSSEQGDEIDSTAPIETVSEQESESETDEIEQVDPPIAQESLSPENELEEGTNEEVEVIRVKKIKLEGIKVVGKIDLPELKPKKEDETDNSEESSLTEKTSDDNTRRKNKQYSKNKRKRQTRRETYEQRVNREKKEEERKLERQHRALKRKKKQYYVDNIQSRSQPKLTKKKNRKQQLPSDKAHHIASKPKNPISRFWGWINGKYDQF